jgi:hypothetical protein
MTPIRLFDTLFIFGLFKFILGTYTLFFFDKVVGGTIITASLIAFGWAIVIIKKESIDTFKSICYFHIMMGILLLIGALILTILDWEEKHLRIILKVIIGTFLALFGLYGLHEK